MKVYQGLQDVPPGRQYRSVTLGVFDGVHLAHRKILSVMLEKAKTLNLRSMVITFYPHPNKVLQPHLPQSPVLMSLSHRLKLFQEMGVKEVLVIPFTKRFAGLSRDYFLHKTLLQRLRVRAIAVGHDFCFGRKALGNTDYLKKECLLIPVEFKQIGALKIRGEVVSSTKIRVLIERGELSLADRMLGRPVSVYGTVIRGLGRGKKIGFPTANLNPHHEALPPAGVYSAYGYLGKKKFLAVIHIGHRPTFNEREKTLEAHFLGLSRDLYGQDIELFFVKKLRDVQKFKDAKSLAGAIAADIRRTRAISF